jgi:transposase
MLAGVAPLEASSGRVTRHRLNRAGDRQLNGALHVIALTRLRQDPATRRDVARRRAEGQSERRSAGACSESWPASCFASCRANRRRWPLRQLDTT